jgi:ABC-2 type transport system ATP-binding protein/lipopolysaccharide transport system ATP-binding protein
VSFALKQGDRVALIGHNGAGKTTLLRVLAGIYRPVSGRIVSEGRIAPLFDISLGMNPDSTGWENIRIRALYLGMKTDEINRKIEAIAEFTELGQFLEMPLRTYSLGMQTRLAFAVSTAIDPEILLLDEGIGAGDAAFIEKATLRLDEFVERAGIMVLASHSMNLVERFCNKALVMEHGRVKFFGPAAEAMDFYGNLSS